MFTQRRLGKLIAGASALALAGMGLFGVAAASADEVSDITPGTIGSITVHKSSADPVEGLNDGTLLDPDPGAGKGLDGVEFTLQPVLFDGVPIDLSTAEGWELAEALPSETAGEALPAGYSLGTGVSQATVGGFTTFSGLELGLYLITETDSGNNLINAAAAPFYVSIPYPNADDTWNYNVHVYPKNTLNTIDQHKSVDDTAKLLGDVVTWTLVTDVPASDLPYKSYTLTDNLSANLEFISWESVSIGSEVLVLDTDYTISPDNAVITLTSQGLTKLDDAGATTVTAVLKTKVISIPEGGVIENTATVNINGTEDEGTTNTNLGTLQLEKKAEGENGALLDGAVFELYGTAPDADGNATSAPLATGTTENGVVKWELHLGIEDDMQSSYWVKETRAPAGYVLPADPWSDELVVTNGQILIETITNHKPTGPDLPLTGASGTVLFTIAGVGLMAAAGGAVLVKRRRARTQG
ncbi:LPXTG-motif cell wall-anchored protein/fimbrial isopeptide formation D2 family protein [Glutamicibacter mysorens]|uniref:LPXTG-motif cell wall-anchored protein/fimbrial isopeptide formation D2 family protein n=1 Tax=Glutamicibacter mysorens TaxID=257984 RepID=A0ABX4MZN8_9MICC|nr:SpaH/EbpB family LPXTG-anchored major pilin [Glutamicibacter mysorens]PJJ43609.1 LPXTG-motif cell wall-anchored protein/fimbrial isopeptide formation D2 family protein [Glutamicibacter mysorens]